MKQTKKIVEHNFVVFMYEVQKAVIEGFRLEADFVPGLYAYHYEAELVKDEVTQTFHTVVYKDQEGNDMIRNATQEEIEGYKETKESAKQEEQPAPRRGRKSASK